MMCVTCDRTLSAGGSSEPMSVDAIELMFAELMGWVETKEGWQCADCTASVDPKADAQGPST